MSALCVRHYALFIFALCVVQVYGTYSIQLCLAPPSLCFRNSFVCTWVCEYHTPRKIKNIGTQKAKRLMFADDIYLLAYTCVVARPYHNSPPVSTWLLTLYEYSSPLAACACCMYLPNVAALSFYFLHTAVHVFRGPGGRRNYGIFFCYGQPKFVTRNYVYPVTAIPGISPVCGIGLLPTFEFGWVVEVQYLVPWYRFWGVLIGCRSWSRPFWLQYWVKGVRQTRHALSDFSTP